MIAQIIIDIPVGQVNRTFDYRVPREMVDQLDLGMRVQVPFGSRQLLGFVVGLSQESDYAGKLKCITKVLDDQAFLTPELLDLADYLAGYLHTFKITLLQAMLPGLLNVDYSCSYRILDPSLQEDLTMPEGQEAVISREGLLDQVSQSTIYRWVQTQRIQADYQVKDKKSTKMVDYVCIDLDPVQLEEILSQTSPHSHRQRDLLAYLIAYKGDGDPSLDQVMAGSQVGRSVILRAQEKGWLTLYQEEVYRDPFKGHTFPQTQAKDLSDQQAHAYQEVAASIQAEEAQTFLLEGVTGSGKTEVYLQLIAACRAAGKSALLLVPEIALTPQIVGQVKGRFQEEVAVLHSGLSLTEKFDEWRRILRGEAQIIVGVRSSVFAPVHKLGLVIIDEEHDASYKQGDNPRYHARDVAIWRSRYHHCPVVLGSATPSLESRARAEVGRYRHLLMTQRIHNNPLPPVRLVDMSQVRVSTSTNELSPLLKEKITQALVDKHQVMLLLNRRGYANYLLCRECGYVPQCPHCDIALTYHKFDNTMKCHYCQYQAPVPKHCPQCHGHHIRQHGAGTQKLTEILQEEFPQARLLRMDNDTTRVKGAHHAILQRFARREADILVGTQMIAKGLDFENVTLVGVINADTSMNIPDFRSGEKTFQLLTQVAGRTGRGRYPGEVIIQTYNPDHYVMQYAIQHNYRGFFYQEMQRRHLADYPPYYFTLLLTVQSKDRGKARAKIYDLKQKIQAIPFKGRDLIALGPSQGSIARIRDYYTYHILLKFKDPQLVQGTLDEIMEENQGPKYSGIYVQIDREPQFFN